jgi:hypothetical protein
MKSIGIAFIISCGLLGIAFAGSPTYSYSGKEAKAPEPLLCFHEHEWQFDIFGQYSVGEGPNQAGLFRDHGWGGGVGINYFFTRNFGLGVDAAWLRAKESDGGDITTIHNFTGSLIFRAPIDHLCLAPYLYAGGGCSVDGDQWATAHAGAGLEWRITPEKYGVFLDGRWTYLGDRFGSEDLNFFSTRVGFRFVF